MNRVFIIHRWEGGPNDDWRPWLKSELEKLNFNVIVPVMPDTDAPTIEKWVAHLKSIVSIPDQNTYFIGHSIGCQAILRYLETVSEKIGGAIFVAGWFSMKNLEDEDTRKIARPWMTKPIDLIKIKKILSQSVLIISDNDPYDCFEENKRKFTDLNSKIIVLHNAGHITENDGFTKLPEVVEQFRLFAGIN